MDKRIIFLVEDNESFAELLEDRILAKNKDCVIYKFRSAETALAKAADGPEIIILDHFLENMDGITCIPLFREFAPNSKIFVYSAQEDIQMLDKAFLFGADAYFYKEGQGFKDILEAVHKHMLNDINSKESWYLRFSNILQKEKKVKAKKVFIAEDNPMFSFAIEHALKEYKHLDVSIYDEPESFLANLNQKPNVIILDYNFKHELHGGDLLKEALKNDPKVKVIMLSAQNEVKVAVDLMRKGAVYYLVKTKNNLKRLAKIVEEI